jgi:3-oxoacyl-[acyl-carrier protein] reductase
MSKLAIVTGAASGIGKAVVERFANEEISSIILDIDEVGGKNVAAEIQRRGKHAEFMRLDVTKESEVQSVFDKIKSIHGRFDILVNVAGGSMHRHPLDEFPLAHWQAVIDVNLTSTFLCCRAVMASMKSQKSGAIVNISSDIGFSGDANRSAYAAAKAGILGLTRTLALELAPFGVRANAVAPGRIATPRVW